ncbi:MULTISPECIES: LacI family DNA-binding transcriptional regulator [Paenarthrobacter]|uniref:LacI family transcriptional regulator n=1 Tax=Paenarthrobacter ureafaciens TaxID=37931 RepID=A0AAX3EGF5_PAEUR|nr:MULTISPECIES: LacI family DNA-binding transcriptional regulator [Paenarthrobacter]NKR14137.1 LacI family transcriptional regulator [Arthrobacter sp. M5]NKR17877.1 LacI family transcriptional regulator [Arthrobacter sp. M6]OEH56836.1 LacI family transcriptional regulator [Arthrobacter sp. D4]OEH63906.1 LacI family transcriptional regulator [Arthrobacter sp. D2]MDO5866204.1 LacI family transcriptional regulator [Paenarthrobacter sp. SD-2]
MARPTVQDVARTAGVSVGTVSRVLNGSPAVSEAAKEKVNAAIKELSYRPLASARDLRRDRTMRVLALAKNLDSLVISEVFRGVGDAAADSGYVSLIAATDGDLDREQQLVDMLRNGSVDGLVIFSPTMPDDDVNTVAEQMSVVQVCEIVDAEAAFGVSIDDRQAAYDITKHLIDTGAKKLAMLAHRGARSGRLREEGFRQALQEAGLEEGQILLGEGNFGFHAGRNLTKKLLEAKELPDAVFCGTDVVAAGCVRELTDAGLKVPDDIAVAGFDDSAQAEMCVPELTTVRQPAYEMGRVAFAELLERMTVEGSHRKGRTFLPHELVIRDSTK